MIKPHLNEDESGNEIAVEDLPLLFAYHPATHTCKPRFAAWAHAAAMCNRTIIGQEGGRFALPHPRSEDDDMAMCSLMGTEEHTGTWLGATDAQTEGEWKWQDDGAPVRVLGGGNDGSYSGWVSGEPNDFGPKGEDCGMLWGTGFMAGWYDLGCSHRIQTRSVAESISGIMSSYVKIDPGDEHSRGPNAFQLRIQALGVTQIIEFWAGGRNLIAGIYTHSAQKDSGEGVSIATFLVLFIIGAAILVQELVFDVMTTKSFLSSFTTSEAVAGKKVSFITTIKSRPSAHAIERSKRDRGLSSSDNSARVWMRRKTRGAMGYCQALVQHFTLAECNAWTNWGDLIMGFLFVFWGLIMMSFKENALVLYNLNLVIAGSAFIWLNFWVLTFFRFHPGLSIFTRTIWFAGNDLFDTLCVFGFLAMCFMMACHAFFGLNGGLQSFVRPSRSFFSLLEMAFNGAEYEAYMTAGAGSAFEGVGFDRPLTPIKIPLFWGVTFVFTIVMSNILIAVICDAYEEVRGERDETHRRESALALLVKKMHSMLCTPYYAFRYLRGAPTDSAGYLRWRRDWFALCPSGWRLVTATTNPFTRSFLADAEIFAELNTAAKLAADGVRGSDGDSSGEAGTGAGGGEGEGNESPLPAAGIIEAHQLEALVEHHQHGKLRGVDPTLILDLFAKSWTEVDVVKRGNVVMEKWRSALPETWRAASAAERSTTRALDRSPKIIDMERRLVQMEKDTKEIKEMLRVLVNRTSHS
eukprot:g1681.t1